MKMILTEWKKIKRSVRGVDISAAFVGKGKKTILIIGCVHGDEVQSQHISTRLVKYFEENAANFKDKRIIILPLANPDGRETGQRTNANGVDINRNFPTKNWELSKDKDEYYSGPKKNSEPETQAIVELIETYEPELIISIHQPYKVVNYDGPAEEIAQIISLYNKYEIHEDIGYPTPGSLGTYAGVERHIPTITLELPENEPDEKVWHDNGLAIVAAITHC